MTIPVVQKCREELESLRREGREPSLVARLSQLVSLLGPRLDLSRDEVDSELG